ncbi:AraC family transcriptional regulator [Virgibacillus halotolerans]|uniref:AraC family transcriptional regulator n=1 Tax=Virgibacillus halotolerans TaxID=1071053 RepID=UPI0019620A1E|nr:AraC family transcriptional regulator [Virgibacillus halotolerans]MBM7599743.1 AraC family transcriptional regulator [Virgibacillus halotolerans]
MEGLQRMTKSIDYIENNLDKEIQIEHAATVACMSKFHFQRMFTMLTGVTVAAYIRNRRLTMAAQELIHSKSKVIDVALKYGYESPESFAKVFRKTHGMSPSEVRYHRHSLKAFPKLSFQIQLKGEEEMDYKIVEKDAFNVIGKDIRTTTIDGANHREIAAFWEDSNQNGFSNELARNAGSLGLLGICMEFDKQQEELTYFIGAEKNVDDMPADWKEKHIPASTWAVFPVHGSIPDAIVNVWERIFSEWFPSTGYEHAGGPEMEIYLDDADAQGEKMRVEVWIPIVKK